MASVLNPVQHARIWHKEAVSLAADGWDVFVLGSGDGKYQHAVHNHLRGYGFPVQRFPAGMRLIMQLVFMWHIFKIRPDVVHIHTPELALPAICLQYLMGYTLIYDRHENYPLQLQDPQAYSAMSRLFLPKVARALENRLYKKAHHILIAETGYQQGIPRQASLIRNTTLPAHIIAHTHSTASYYMIGGTLGARYGTQECIALWEALHALDGRPLLIAGISREPKLTEQIYALQLRHPDTVHLYGIETHVEYELLQNLIRSSYAMLYLFPDAQWLQGKFPTRFYECMGYGVKMVYSGISEWDALLSVYPCAVRYAGSAVHIADTLKQMAKCSTEAVHYSWAADALTLCKIYDAIWAGGEDFEK